MFEDIIKEKELEVCIVNLGIGICEHSAGYFYLINIDGSIELIDCKYFNDGECTFNV